MGAALLAGGCARKAKTPEQAVTNFVESIQTGNKALFTASVASDDTEAADALFECWAASFDFQSRFQKAYGRQTYLVSPTTAPITCDYRNLEVSIEPEDDNAVTAMVPDGAKALTVVKKGEWWHVDLSDLLPKPDGRRKFVRTKQAFTKVLSGLTSKIGNKGQTVEAFEHEVFGCLLIAYVVAASPFSGGDANADWTPAPTPQQSEDDAVATSYTVRPGDTLTGIARKTYGPGHAGKYRRIFEANRDKLNSPDVIPIGIELTIPKQ